MKRIMIVDDAMFMRKLLRDLLESAGFEICAEAGNGMEAFEEYKKNLPDLVTMDITMPGVSGLDGLRLIKAQFPDAKVIMCSAMGQEKMVTEAIIGGAMGFLVKPFEKGRVVDEIKRILGVN